MFLSSALAYAAQERATVETDLLSLVGQMGPVVLGVLIILLLFSVISWGIMIEKWRIINRAKRQNSKFLRVFRKSSKFSDVQEICKNLPFSPMVGLFQAGYSELRYQLNVAQVSHLEAAMNNPGSTSAKGRVRIHNLEGINRALQRAASVEVNRLERSLNFLATTAGVAPFIGLFGTVWGVVTAFQDIARQGTTSLVTVAPGIAEALIATGAGLFAAIPALIGYNFLLNKIKVLSSEMDDFSMEFISVTERSFIDNVPARQTGTTGAGGGLS
jgi:biopolymer transport protein TolQ